MLERHHKAREVSTKPLGLDYAFSTSLVLVAFAVRVASLQAQGLWRDEVDQWRFALQPWSAMLQNFTRAGWNGPLYSPLLRLWIALTGESVYAMRYFSLLWGVLGVALGYVLARRLLGRASAMWSALLLALSPYLVWYAQEIKMYTWVPMLVLLALYALDRACARSSWPLWLTVLVATSLAVYSHILAALLIPVEVCWFWLHPRRDAMAWKGGLVVLALLTLPYLPLLMWQFPLVLEARDTGFSQYTVIEMALVLFNGWTAGISQGFTANGPALVYGVTFLGGMVLLGAGALVRDGRLRRLATLVLWLLLPLLAIWVVSLRGPIFTDRYLIWTAPAFYLLAAVGLDTVRRASRWLALPALAVVLALFGSGLYVQATTPIKPEFHLATRYLMEQREPGELLLFQIPYNHHVVDFYTNAPLDPWAEAPYTNWRQPDGTYQMGANYVDEELRRIVAGHQVVWLVYSEAPLWDDRELVKAWLAEHGELVEQKGFAGVTLYQYLITEDQVLASQRTLFKGDFCVPGSAGNAKITKR